MNGVCNTNIYYRLSLRTPSALKNNEENFLPEALGDLLCRLTSEQIVVFMKEVLLKQAVNDPWYTSFMESWAGKSLRWETQYRITGEKGRRLWPDLVLLVDHRPILVIEAKLDAPTYSEQLREYASWLQRRVGSPDRPTAVVLLRNKGEPPDHHGIEDGLGCNVLRILDARWADVRNWLCQSEPASSADADEFLAGLQREFAGFMRGRGIGDDPAEQTAIEVAAETWFGGSEQAYEAVESVSKIIDDLAIGLTFGVDGRKPSVLPIRSTIWSYAPILPKTSDKVYISWGLYFPNGYDEWHCLHALQAGGCSYFLSVESDKGMRDHVDSLSQDDLPPGWQIWPGKGLVRLFQIPSDKTDRYNLHRMLTTWTQEALKEIVSKRATLIR